MDEPATETITKGGSMFSVKQKREISDKIQKILRETNHPELPDTEIQFLLHIEGAESWSWADISNNNDVPNTKILPCRRTVLLQIGFCDDPDVAIQGRSVIETAREALEESKRKKEGVENDKPA